MGGIASLRQFLSGWGANLHGDINESKKAILDFIKSLDIKANNMGLSTEEWMERDIKHRVNWKSFMI